MVFKHAMYEILSNSTPWVLFSFHEMLKPLEDQHYNGGEKNVSDTVVSVGNDGENNSLIEDLCLTQDLPGATAATVNQSMLQPFEPVLMLPAPPAST
eukprot:CAMPEP_0116037084 /NCGR_PEP_ID=MMETSP0321-20121206/21738_1 /TAXON_ID=163516 /ORGANISM="Leptocylindrus danicus var. danicus, Strain B650" /LENGTH=96 /DNA_ID=CAMNT_0003515011 /DNA_START=115 /DNA_END=402 /DNA_ORIENTATION=+